MQYSPTSTIFWASVVGDLKEWREVNQRKKAKSQIPSLVHVRNKEEHLQAKNKRDGFLVFCGSGEGAHVQMCTGHP